MRAECARGAREHHRSRAFEKRLDIAQATCNPLVGQDGQVERALRTPLLLGERFERLYVVVESQLLSKQSRRREGQPRVEAAPAHVSHLRGKLLAAPAAPQLDKSAGVEE